MLNRPTVRATALIFFVLACLLGFVLIVLLHIGAMEGAAASVIGAGLVVSAVVILQQRLIRQSVTFVRAEIHSELGEVRILGNSWHSSLRGPEQGRHFTLEGRGRRSGPTALQMSLWEDIRSDLKNLSDVAVRALSDASDKPAESFSAEEFRLASVWLDLPNEFSFTFLYPSESKWEPLAGYVRFKNKSVIGASWHRFKRSTGRKPDPKGTQ